MYELPVIAEFLGPTIQIIDRGLGDGDPGALDAAAGCVFEPCPPTRPDFENMISRFQPQLLVTVVELPNRRDVQCFRSTCEDALRVARRLGVQEAEEEFWIDIVVRGYRRLVGPHLPEQ